MKEREYRYDAIRGFCMFLIVVQHLVFKGGYTFEGQTGNLIYVGIDLFVMQTFFFLSGLFSKHPEKNRDHLFQALLWPVVIVGIGFWAGMIGTFGLDKAILSFEGGRVPYAMWFLVVLFFYRYFQKYYIHIPHLFTIALALYFLSGIFEPLSSHGFGIARTFTFFVSFLAGYLLDPMKVGSFAGLKSWQTILLGIVVITVTYLAVSLSPERFYEAVKLSCSYRKAGLTVMEGFLVRGFLLVISSGWILFLLNLFSNRKGFWAHVGMNTMPIYIFHLLFAGIFRSTGFTFGLYSFSGKEGIYLLVLLGVSLLLTAALSTGPAGKAYDFLMGKSYDAFTGVMKRALRLIDGIEKKCILAFGRMEEK